jgi:arginine exporter protein ArgO
VPLAGEGGEEKVLSKISFMYLGMATYALLTAATTTTVNPFLEVCVAVALIIVAFALRKKDE